jgi:lysine 6-dehydrogenase
MCDFGGNTDLSRRVLAMDAEAKAAGITLTPDCGQVPGLGNSLCAYTIGLLDEPRDILMYDGGIPQHPEPPWNYILTFNIEGLTNEYYGTTIFIRDGKLTELPSFLECETVEFPAPIGTLEAFLTAGGTSTMPWTYEGKLRTLQNLTLRWPGHYAQWKAFNDAGLLEQTPIEVDGVKVSPRQVLHALLGPKLYARPDQRDLVIVRVVGRGLKDGRDAEVTVDLIDRHDETTGFTAMERTTGWHAAIMCQLHARGATPRGGLPVELAVPGSVFADELRKRDFNLTVRWA